MPEFGRGEVLLGIDPGLRVTGFGLILTSSPSLSYLSHGAIRTDGGDRPGRLLQIHERIKALIAEWRVDEVAIEKQFVALNASSAFVIGEARAAAILAAAISGTPVFEYTPAEVKQSVTSYGRSGKEQVQEMVRLQFGLSAVPEPADAADALAIATCHAAQRLLPKASHEPRSLRASGRVAGGRRGPQAAASG